jgi:hypothetical protein
MKHLQRPLAIDRSKYHFYWSLRYEIVLGDDRPGVSTIHSLE